MNSRCLKFIGDCDDSSSYLSKQWCEYAHIYINKISPDYYQVICREINHVLRSQSYLGGNTIAESDYVVFNGLKHIMEQFTFQDKEKYVNLSRWYNSMQREAKNSIITKFSRMLLY